MFVMIYFNIASIYRLQNVFLLSLDIYLVR